MALGPGSIALAGYNADADNLVFVVLEPVVAGSVIAFTDGDWEGLAFSEDRATWTWTATEDLAAGSVVSVNGRGAGAVSSSGDVAFEGAGAPKGTSLSAYYRRSDSSISLLDAISVDGGSHAVNTVGAAGRGVAGASSGHTARNAANVPGVSPNDQDPSEQGNSDEEEQTEDNGGSSGNEQNGEEQSETGENQSGDGEDGNSDDGEDDASGTPETPESAFGTDGDDNVVIDEETNVAGAILLGAGNDILLAATDLGVDLEVDGGAGDDNITTGAGDDVVLGGIGGDVINGRSGDDVIDGGEGDDVLKGGAGDDGLVGGAGNDTLIGGAGDDVLDGGEGMDTADYSSDRDGIAVNLAEGEAEGEGIGADRLANVENVTGGKGADRIVGDATANVIRGGDGADELRGGAGNDTIYGDAGSDTIYGDEGDDRIHAGGSADYVHGGAGNDIVYGSDGNDEIHGDEGNDQLHGEGGDDMLSGDAGNDTLYGGIGADTLTGGEGNDQLYGQDGNDTLVGGAGFDKLHGGSGIDTADYSGDSQGIYVRLDRGWAMAQADRLPNWQDLVAAINANAIEHDDLIDIENITGTEFNDAIVGDDGDNVIHGLGGNDILAGLDGNDKLYGGAGNDRLTGDDGLDLLDGGDGDDIIEATSGDTALGGAGNDRITVVGGTEGGTVVDGGTGSDTITVRDGGHVSSALTLGENDRLVVDAGGKLVAGNAVTWSGGNVVVDNAGLIEGSRVLQTGAGAQGHLEFNNLAGGVVRGNMNPNGGAADAAATITINNAGLIESSSDARVMDFRNFDGAGGSVTINNLVGGIIRNVGATSDDADVLRPGQNGTVNNWGTIVAADGLVGGGDLIDFQSDRGGKVNNYAGGLMEGSRHAVTGDRAVTVVNEGTMIGRNGSAVNIDNDGSEEETVRITNRGVMEGRSAELSDSDGDAIDVDGLLFLNNYGRVAGVGHQGYHDGEPNVSEGIAIGGGTIINNAAGEIYGYGRAIQVDNSSNANALGKTLVVNDGLIQGDGHGPEGVSPEHAAQFDLRGNEAINFVGEHDDEIINNSAGRIIGGVSMGGGNDRLSNSGLIQATGGSAIDMGDGDDVVNLYIGSVVEGEIRLGAGNDRLTMNSYLGGVTVDAGDGNDDITTSSGDDVIYGGAGNDYIYAAEGNDRIFAGEGDDTILADLGNDIIDGGDGYDTLFLARATGPISVDFASGRVSAEGIGTDTFTNIENLLFGAGNDIVIGSNGDDSFDGGDGNDTLKGGAGDDTISGSAGDDTLEGGSGDDTLSGGVGNDLIKAGSGDDMIDGGDGDDDIDGGSGDDIVLAGAGNDKVYGGSGDDRIDGGVGNDELEGGSGHDTFVFPPGFGHDTILDFKTTGTSSDVLEFDSSIFADFESAMAAADQVGCNVVFTFDADNTLALEGVQLSSLTADDFRFV